MHMISVWGIHTHTRQYGSTLKHNAQGKKEEQYETCNPYYLLKYKYTKNNAVCRGTYHN